MTEKWLRKKDARKKITSVFEIIVLLGAFLWAGLSIWRYRGENPVIPAMPPEKESTMIASDEITAGYQNVGEASGVHFIAIAYNGVVYRSKEDGKIVNLQTFTEQLQTLKASGYQTITQQDIINAYNTGASLPEKALLLIFEDGIYDSAVLVQPSLEACNYKATMCTYACNLSDTENHYITGRNAKAMEDSSYWELGSNGYRLSYINIFDRYENYFGHMTLPEFLDVHTHLRRDYNHYLMDFLRDEYRLREETVEEMEERIAWDYEKMDELYQQELGYVPGLYILMHSNTGAYGNDPLVSKKNEEMMQKVFAMNFNRQGTCLNMMDSSIYDLSRLQARQYFTTNHLMMRIWDDTGHKVMFRLGDASIAKDWQRLTGVTEFSDHRIMVTSMPYGTGAVMLKNEVHGDLDLTVMLQGNQIGQQSIALHADENGEGGVIVELHNNTLYIEDPSSSAPLFELDLFEFDGGPYVSVGEDELEGKKAKCRTIIENDSDDARVQEAKQELEYLETLRALSLAEGGEPYIPEMDIDDQDDRDLHIQITGSRMNVWLDGQLVADHVRIPDAAGGHIVLGSEITRDNERYSQTNLSDDVYDAIFRNLRISTPNGGEVYSYAEVLSQIETDVKFVDRAMQMLGQKTDK